MREIKFRAWDKHEKRFIDGWVLDQRGVYHSGREYEDYIPQLDLELQQYTGLHDKNGKEMFKSDYVEFTEGGRKKIGEIVWMEKEALFAIKDKDGWGSFALYDTNDLLKIDTLLL
jgi:uncharacterized phage protein (TIGR01671 family)